MLPRADALHTTLLSVNIGKPHLGKPLRLIFIKAHDKLMQLTSRWPFTVSEVIPFGPQTHHALGTGAVIQQPTDRQMLPHPEY